jgi:hypothetical protein
MQSCNNPKRNGEESTSPVAAKNAGGGKKAKVEGATVMVVNFVITSSQ